MKPDLSTSSRTGSKSANPCLSTSATDESFNGKFRDEHVSLQRFRNRREAAVAIEEWLRYYNEVRPHSSLGYRTPLELKATDAATTSERRSQAEPARADQEEPDTTRVTLTGAIFQ